MAARKIALVSSALLLVIITVAAWVFILQRQPAKQPIPNQSNAGSQQHSAQTRPQPILKRQKQWQIEPIYTPAWRDLPLVTEIECELSNVSIAVVEGYPAICFKYDQPATKRKNDRSVTGLMYMRALDAFGTQWPTPTIVFNSETQGAYPPESMPDKDTHLFIVQGRPAIGYVSGQAAMVYVRAKDSLGSQWQRGDLIGYFEFNYNRGVLKTGNVSRASFCSIGSLPAVAFIDGYTNYSMKFLLANDADGRGDDWGAFPSDSGKQQMTYSKATYIMKAPAIYRLFPWRDGAAIIYTRGFPS